MARLSVGLHVDGKTRIMLAPTPDLYTQCWAAVDGKTRIMLAPTPDHYTQCWAAAEGKTRIMLAPTPDHYTQCGAATDGKTRIMLAPTPDLYTQCWAAADGETRIMLAPTPDLYTQCWAATDHSNSLTRVIMIRKFSVSFSESWFSCTTAFDDHHYVLCSVFVVKDHNSAVFKKVELCTKFNATITVSFT